MTDRYLAFRVPGEWSGDGGCRVPDRCMYCYKYVKNTAAPFCILFVLVPSPGPESFGVLHAMQVTPHAGGGGQSRYLLSTPQGPATSKDGKYVSITLGNKEGRSARSAVQRARKMLAMALLERAHTSGSFRTWVRLLVPSR